MTDMSMRELFDIYWKTFWSQFAASISLINFINFLATNQNSKHSAEARATHIHHSSAKLIQSHWRIQSTEIEVRERIPCSASLFLFSHCHVRHDDSTRALLINWISITIYGSVANNGGKMRAGIIHRLLLWDFLLWLLIFLHQIIISS